MKIRDFISDVIHRIVMAWLCLVMMGCYVMDWVFGFNIVEMVDDRLLWGLTNG